MAIVTIHALIAIKPNEVFGYLAHKSNVLLNDVRLFTHYLTCRGDCCEIDKYVESIQIR